MILVLILVGLAAFVAVPLYRAPSGRPAPDRTELEARREALATALRELELDRASGLLDATEHERQRDAYTAELAGVLRDLTGNAREPATD